MADDDQHREWERRNQGQARDAFSGQGKARRDQGGDAGQTKEWEGYPPPSKAELDGLKEDRKRDKARGPAPAPAPQKGQSRDVVAEQKQRQRRQHIAKRERRIQHNEQRLQRQKGRARGDFDQSQ
jgi:hypothetical protein